MLAANTVGKVGECTTVMGEEELDFWLTKQQTRADNTRYGTTGVKREFLYNYDPLKPDQVLAG